MFYSYYLAHIRDSNMNFFRVRNLGVSVTSSHRAIPRWTWHIAGDWKGFQSIEGSPDDLLLLPCST